MPLDIRQYFRRYFENLVFGWSPNHKLAFLAFLVMAELTSYLLWLVFVYFSPSVHQYVNIDTVKFLIPIFVFMLLVMGNFSILMFYSSKNRQFLWLWECLLLSSYSLGACFVGYHIGQSSVIAGTSLMSSIVLTLLFVRRAIVYFMLVFNMFMLFFSLHLIGSGVIHFPTLYAPNVSSYNSFWIISYFFLSFLKLLCTYILVDAVIDTLRKRFFKYKFMSEHDAMTALLNRRTMQTKMATLLQTTKQASLIFLDIDHFKSINDTYGHMVGDKVIKATAAYLKKVIREEDYVSRFGGEEFLIFLNDTDVETALQVAQRILSGMANLDIAVNEHLKIKVRASIGLTSTDIVNATYAEKMNIDHMKMLRYLLEQADNALYMAKENGRNQVYQYH